jgi:hypothetical protein
VTGRKVSRWASTHIKQLTSWKLITCPYFP